MWFTLRILLIGLLFHSGYGAPIDEEEPEVNDEPSPKETSKIVSESGVYSVSLGTEVVLPCKVENRGKDDQVVMWEYKSTSNVAATAIYADQSLIAQKWKEVYFLDSEGNLHIKNFNQEFAGRYVCQLSISKQYISHVVGLREGATIEHVTGKKYIEFGTDLMLNCSAKGFPEPKITWIRQKTETSPKEQLNYGAVATIATVNDSDSGIYTCNVNNDAGSDSKSIVVKVVKGVEAEPAVVYASMAESSTKICCVYDKPRKLEWYKDGKELELNSRLSGENDKHSNCLVIKTVKEEDLGIYSCQTAKSANSIFEKADVQLKGSPSKPKIISVQLDDNKYPVITWEVNSLSPITSYKIFYKKPEENEWKKLVAKEVGSEDKIKQMSHTFSDVQNGSYDVKFEVTNKYGANDLISSGELVVDRIEPNVIVSAGITNGALSHYDVSGLCIVFAILMKLWSC